MHGTDPFLLQLLVIFLWAKIFGEVFEKLRMPAVLGEILAGVILGPFATGMVVPSETTQSVASIGAIFLLFSVGLETHPKELLGVGRRALGVAIAGIVLPFALGFGYMLLRAHPGYEAAFVGAAMVATSVGITARVMGDLRVLHTRAAKIILGAAVFDDILGMLLLAVVTGVADPKGVDYFDLGVIFVEATLFALFMILVAPRLIARMKPGVKRLSTQNAPLVLALAICLGLSVMAENIGMAAIIGAFFAGLAFAEYAPEWGLHARIGGITELLAPLFFFTMGARLNLTVFSREVIVTAVVIAIFAIVSKLVGCGLPVLKEGWRNALRVGVGMVPRGEVGLIVALVGLNMAVISQAAYAVVIFMTAVTTLVAPPFLRMLFRDAQMTSEQVLEEVPVERAP